MTEQDFAEKKLDERYSDGYEKGIYDLARYIANRGAIVGERFITGRNIFGSPEELVNRFLDEATEFDLDQELDQ
jgi:hypothetical protein